MDLPDRLGVQPRTAVGKVVAGDTGDGRVAQPHLRHRLGDAARLVDVVRRGLAGVDVAEVTAPRALVAADEEGRLAVLPALVDVGTAGLFTDRVQALGLHQRLQRGVLRTHHRPGLDPRRLLLDRRLRVAHLEAQHPAAFRLDRSHSTAPWPGPWRRRPFCERVGLACLATGETTPVVATRRHDWRAGAVVAFQPAWNRPITARGRARRRGRSAGPCRCSCAAAIRPCGTPWAAWRH